MELPGHVMCDTPGCTDTTPADSERLALWERITGNDVPDAWLCERCAGRMAAGTLADPFPLRCARCGRTRHDDVHTWFGVRDDDGQMIDVCDACSRPDDRTNAV